MKKSKNVKFAALMLLVCAVLFCTKPVGVQAVSYTHLDVYKRQVIKSRIPAAVPAKSAASNCPV